MAKNRDVLNVHSGLLTIDGGGVQLARYIGTPQLDYLDPFLMLDFFHSDKPEDYIAGFPSHPHRGFETVTYLLAGRVRHQDSTGRHGLIEPGGVQWMKAGRGIVHSEMPEQDQGRLAGFQLWVNLPEKLKMTDPTYQEFDSKEIPVELRPHKVRIRVIAGQTSLGTQSPINNVFTEPLFFDIDLPMGQSFCEPIPVDYSAFIFVIDGKIKVCGSSHEKDVPTLPEQLVLLGDGDQVQMMAEKGQGRCLLIGGRPLKEPISRYGPFVMNTRKEVMQAAQDYQSGNF